LKRSGHITPGLVLLIGLILLTSSSGSAGKRPVQLTAAKEAFICPAFSPNGRWIAVTRTDWGGIWTMRPDGNDLRQVTGAPGAGYQFAWSPDGGHIAYRTEKMVAGKRYFAIRIVDAETGDTEELTEFQRYLGTPRWVLGDGTVVFETDRNGTLAQALVVGLIPPQPKVRSPYRVATTSRDLRIWISEADGSGRTMVSDPEKRCFGPVLSPDKSRVCYSVLSGGGHIAVASTDGSTRQDLGYGSNPSWSPDGQFLVYEVTADDGHVITGSDLYIVEVDGSGRIQLTDTPELFERWPSWSPDGGRVVYSAAGAIFSISIPPSLRSQEEEAP
jgi:Tol biopolymer transport system component